VITLKADGRVFRVEFRHQQRTEKRGELPPFTRAITTCVIAAVEDGYVAFTAIGTTWCWDLDNFSRRTGRLKAFKNAVTQCGALRGSTVALLAAYMERDPDPPPRPKPAKLSECEKRNRWAQGWEIRQKRENARVAREGNYDMEIGMRLARGENV
jgi:hypothetical protein